MSSVSRKAGEYLAAHSRKLFAVATLCAVFTYILLWTTAATAEAHTPDDEGTNFPVTVTLDGANKVVIIPEGATVADLLDEMDYEMSVTDFVSPSLDTQLAEFDKVVIISREYGTYTVEESLPFKTYYRYSPDVRAGTEVVETPGQEGVKVDTYARYTTAGAIHEEVLLSSEIESEPVDEVILVGFKSRPVSSLDFDWEFDDNGEPVEYVDVISGKASGYSAGSGAATASGKPAMVGHVAVNPNVIPYGSKLFIQSADGEFIYGYAIAADTGTALMQNVVAVDLFYDTYAESAANGIRHVDIFVLE